MELPYEQALVGRLHADILRIVFWIFADDSRENYTDRGAQMVRLGHVCAFWRAVLMDMPTLWARNVLAFGVGRAFNDILARAQDTPLDLRCNLKIIKKSPYEVAQLVPRARFFSCSTASSLANKFVSDHVLSRSLPLLQTLILHQTPQAARRPPVDHAQPLAYMTALNDLKMSRIYMRPPLNGRLVSLSIHEPSILLRPSLDDILDVLSHNTALKDLVLKHALDERHTITSFRPRIVMPALASLYLSIDTINTLHSLLGAIHMPALQDLNVSDERYTKILSEDVCSTLASAFSAYYIAFTLPSSPRLVLDASFSQNRLDISLDTSYKESGLQQRFKITQSFAGRFLNIQDVANFSRRLVDARIASCVYELHWWALHEGHNTTEYWDMIFSYFGEVEELFLTHTPVLATEDSCIKPTLDSLCLLDAEGRLRLPYLRRVFTRVCLPLATRIGSSAHDILVVSRELKQAVWRRKRLGAAVYEPWLFVYLEEGKDQFIEWLNRCSDGAGVKLTDLRRRGDRLEWRLKVDEE